MQAMTKVTRSERRIVSNAFITIHPQPLPVVEEVDFPLERIFLAAKKATAKRSAKEKDMSLRSVS